MKLLKLKRILREIKIKEEFAGNGVSGVAGIGVAVNNDQTQAEPGVHMKKKKDFPKPNTPVMKFFKRTPPKM